MNKLNLIAVVILAVALVACSGTPPELDVTANERSTLFGTALVITVVSREDSLKIDDIKVNRGGCDLAPGNVDHIQRGAIDLKFGQSYEIYSYSCSLRQLQELTLVVGGNEWSMAMR